MPTYDFFTPWNSNRGDRVEEVAERLDIKSSAMNDARRYRDDDRDRGAFETEQAIENTLEQETGGMKSKKLERAATVKPTLREILASLFVFAFVGLLAQIKSQLSVVRDDLSQIIKTARQAEIKAKREYNLFFQTHTPAPETLAYHSKFAEFWSWICFLIVVEAVANSVFFAKATAYGIGGGFGYAIFGAIIITLAGLAGGMYGWRYLDHPIQKNKRRGYAVMFCSILAAGSTLLVLANYRDRIQVDRDASFDVSILLRPNEWFAFQAIETWMLFCLGLIVFFIAALKGAGFIPSIVARCPNFAPLDREVKRTEKRRLKAEKLYRQKLQETIEQALQPAEDDLTDALNKKQQADQMIAQLEELEDTVDRSCKAEVGRGNEWLKMYRHAFLAVIDSQTLPPAHFKRFFRVEDFMPQPLDLADLYTLREQITMQVARKTEELQTLRDELHAYQQELFENLDNERATLAAVAHQDLLNDEKFTRSQTPKPPHNDDPDIDLDAAE